MIHWEWHPGKKPSIPPVPLTLSNGADKSIGNGGGPYDEFEAQQEILTQRADMRAKAEIDASQRRRLDAIGKCIPHGVVWNEVTRQEPLRVLGVIEGGGESSDDPEIQALRSKMRLVIDKALEDRY